MRREVRSTLDGRESRRAWAAGERVVDTDEEGVLADVEDEEETRR